MPSENVLAVILMGVFAALLGILLLGVSAFLGRVKRNPEKLSVYECGVDPTGSARERFSLKFYLIAIFFLVFDIEIIFLYPWALIFRKNLERGGLILFEMMCFLAILVVGYLYIWKKGGLDWK
ncbi:MAG: NADH-quinone oxidoreductase subunit A [Deltaproteobacteria bacterium]|nr:NADH-quinone oxidoreductase subunit A [Deltaproteobacteria bacterium]